MVLVYCILFVMDASGILMGILQMVRLGRFGTLAKSTAFEVRRRNWLQGSTP